jgi:DNA-binding NtrC family response regulator
MNFNVLIVDDEQDFREITGKHLARQGIECMTAEGGAEALKILQSKHSVDVVLLDIKMPGMDGIECLKKIKEQHPLIEVIMLTGHASVDSGIQGMKLGAFDYLMKPIEIGPLVDKLSDAYQKRKAHKDKIEMAMVKQNMNRPF